MLSNIGFEKNILVLGSFGQDNLGDELILEAVISCFKENKLFINSSAPQASKEKYLDKENVVFFNTEILKDFFKKIHYFYRCEYYLFAGGSLLLEHRTYVENVISYAALIKTFFACLIGFILKKRVFLCSIGAGPLTKKKSKTLVRMIIGLADIISCRDDNSYKLLFSLAGSVKRKKKIFKSCDLIFLLQEKLKRATALKKDRKIYIGIVLNYHVNIQENNYRHLEEEFVKFVDFYKNNPDFYFILIPFQPSFMRQNDLKITREFSQKIENRNMAIKFGGNLEEINNIFSSLDLLVGARLHSLIIAALMGVPFIGINHDPKICNFMTDCGVNDFCLEYGEFNFASLKNCVTEIINAKDSFNKTVNERREINKKEIIMPDKLIDSFVTIS